MHSLMKKEDVVGKNKHKYINTRQEHKEDDGKREGGDGEMGKRNDATLLLTTLLWSWCV